MKNFTFTIVTEENRVPYFLKAADLAMARSAMRKLASEWELTTCELHEV